MAYIERKIVHFKSVYFLFSTAVGGVWVGRWVPEDEWLGWRCPYGRIRMIVSDRLKGAEGPMGMSSRTP